ncbi:hypothetical protein [Streptomyces phytophilus]|uniref:hypothetical protein n=1 Tax=Streptomyces phytophilus TaxID=722715 RepID=UPI0015F02A44|nr:hypothetical protein [Streptomyces phytophilus]
MKSWQTRTFLGVAALAAPFALAAPAPASAPADGAEARGSGTAAAAEAVPNNDPSFLQVYDANVENLPTTTESCPGDWHDLMYYMRLQENRPDIYLVQQISNRAQLDLLLTRMEEHFGESYAGVLAENDPADYKNGCSGKVKQTNGVIWRTDRLSLKTSASPDNRWQAQREYPAGSKQCVNNDQPRSKGVKALLLDKLSGKTVTAASFHWPTQDHGGTYCNVSNAGELSNELTEDGYGVADLFVAGGDTNHSASSTNGQDNWTTWYKATNGDIGGQHRFRDAVYAGCADAGGSIPDCLADKWTLHTTTPRRIDFLLARNATGAPPRTSNPVVPTFDEGDAADLELTGSDNRDMDYSDHRAVGARIHY